MWNVPVMIRKLENLEKEDDKNDSEDPQEEEEANESDTNSDLGIGHTSDDPDEDTSSAKDSDEEEDTVKPCPDCGKVHSIQPLLQKLQSGSNPFGFLVKFKYVPKEMKEGKDEEKEEKKEEVE